MASNLQNDIFSKRFALRVAAMIDSRLIWHKHYFRWADRMIDELDEPPNWIVEIATITCYPDAVAAVHRYVYSEPFEPFDREEYADDYVACLYLRYHSGAISWATFLSDAGSFTDAETGRRCCEYFYDFLNKLEDNEYSHTLESAQRKDIEAEFSDAISRISPLYDMFMGYFREHVANEV